MSNKQEKRSRYGTLGLDVGIVGRWSRLGWGILILLPITVNVIFNLESLTESLGFYALVAVYLISIVVAYTFVYWFLGERLFARANPWINTTILVGPAFLVAWWELLVRPFTGISLPLELSLAMGLYIGISFILQWRIAYGGCEVVAVPILLFKRRYTTYCIPLVALDAVEKAVVDRSAKSGQELREAR